MFGLNIIYYMFELNSTRYTTIQSFRFPIILIGKFISFYSMDKNFIGIYLTL